MTEDEYDDPEPNYECMVCGATSHKPKPIVLCELRHTKEKLNEILQR